MELVTTCNEVNNFRAFSCLAYVLALVCSRRLCDLGAFVCVDRPLTSTH